MNLLSARSVMAAGAMFVLLGAGCGGGAAKSAESGVWQSSDAGKTWTSRNVLPTSTGVGSLANADVFSLTFDPQNNAVAYLGTRQNGLFVTLDGGATWERPQHEALRSGTVIDVAVDPHDMCTYYVLKINRVAKTTTCGRTFDTEMYVETRGDVLLSAMAIDWYNSSTLWLASTEGDIWRSDDAGATWRATARVGDNVTSLMVSSADSRIILAGTNRNGVYRTVDGGANWLSLKKDLGDYSKANVVGDFDQTKDGGMTVMRTGYGIFTSLDQGASWKPLTLVTGKAEVNVRALAVHPTDGNTIMYATDSTFYLTTSGGSSWATEELPTAKSAAILANDPANPGRIWLGLQTLEE